MEGQNVFTDLNQAFEQVVEYATENGMAPFVTENEIQHSELLTAVVNEASRRLKERNVIGQDGLANVVTGRRKYQEPTASNKIEGITIELSNHDIQPASKEIEHDYQYLQSILSNYDIGRLKHAVKVGKPIIVEGIQGPTGKTTLIRYLRERGAKAIQYDLSEVFTLDKPLTQRKEQPFKL